METSLPPQQNVKPKKSLGQNFLTSIPARNAIIEAGTLTPGETVVEIGPGKGMLTSGLLEKKVHLFAVEKDTDLVSYLKEKFSAETNLTLIEGDALSYVPPTTPYKIIANIPYYITGAILSYYLTLTHQPTKMVVLIQKEVAQRIVAQDQKGITKHSLLSLSVQAYGNPRIVYKVSKGSFHPIPKVDSAVLVIDSISRKNFVSKKHEDTFFMVIHSGFAHKRKLLIRNLETLTTKDTLHSLFLELHLAEKIRAEDVTLTQWLRFSELLSTRLNSYISS